MERRQQRDRRRLPSAAVDVTRLEHENLYSQVEEILRTLRRMESVFRTQSMRIERLESELDEMVRRLSRTA